MFQIVLILCIIIFILIFRLYLLNRGIKNITNQLKEYNTLTNNKKIDITLSNKSLELLADTINEHITISNRLRNEQKKAQSELMKQVANISHDLRTPLTSIMGYVQMIKKGKSDKKNNELYIDRIETRAKDLYELIENFFTLSFTQSQEYLLELTVVDLRKEVIEVMISNYDLLHDKGIILEADFEEIPYLVKGEKVAIKRVILNLMANLIKHSKGNSIIRLERGDHIRLSIISDANGFQAENKEKIFDRFFTGDENREYQNVNTGLGLAIVKSLMIKMDGMAGCDVYNGKLIIYCEWKRD